MPRKWLEKVVAFPAYQEGVLYLLRVVAVNKSANPRGMRVVFEHLDDDQAGRRHEQVLSTPMRPAGLTYAFVAACGLSAQIGEAVCPDECVGRMVRASFAKNSQADWNVATFALATSAAVGDGDERQSGAPLGEQAGTHQQTKRSLDAKSCNKSR